MFSSLSQTSPSGSAMGVPRPARVWGNRPPPGGTCTQCRVGLSRNPMTREWHGVMPVARGGDLFPGAFLWCLALAHKGSPRARRVGASRGRTYQIGSLAGSPHGSATCGASARRMAVPAIAKKQGKSKDEESLSRPTSLQRYFPGSGYLRDISGRPATIFWFPNSTALRTLGR